MDQRNDTVDLCLGAVEAACGGLQPARDADNAMPPLGRVTAVSGSHVNVEFGSNAADLAVGALLGLRAGRSLVIGTLCDICLQARSADQHACGGASGRIELIGEIVDAEDGARRFQSGVSVYPRLGADVIAAGGGELQIIFELANADTIEIGRLQQDASIAAAVNVEELVRKHFAVVGSTGSGKSSGLAVILRRIMAARSDLRMLLIDAHNEYAECFDDRAHVFGPHNLRLPFWLFNFEEIVQIVFGSRAQSEHEVSLLADLIPLAKTEYARAKTGLRAAYRAPQADGGGRFSVDTPVPYRLEDLIAAAESRMGKLENSDLAIRYQRLIARLNAARRNPRYAFIFDDGVEANDTLADILCGLLRLKDGERPIAIVQLAGFPAEIMEVIVSALFRLAFEFGVWSDGISPLLIVCEEAHNYANADREVGFRTAREGLSRIAKEGRKHGVFLGLVTQRPHQLDPTLISQCSTVFAMRLGHEDDQRIVRAAVSDSASRLLSFLPSLGTREALVIGAATPTVTRIRFEELPAHCIPRSQAGWSGDLEAGTGIDDEVIAAIVGRWRATPTIENTPPSPAVAELKLRAGAPMSWSVPTFKG